MELRFLQHMSPVLGLCIGSVVFCQTYDFELIVVDNDYNHGSKPGWSVPAQRLGMGLTSCL